MQKKCCVRASAGQAACHYCLTESKKLSTHFLTAIALKSTINKTNKAKCLNPDIGYKYAPYFSLAYSFQRLQNMDNSPAISSMVEVREAGECLAMWQLVWPHRRNDKPCTVLYQRKVHANVESFSRPNSVDTLHEVWRQDLFSLGSP